MIVLHVQFIERKMNVAWKSKKLKVKLLIIRVVKKVFNNGNDIDGSVLNPNIIDNLRSQSPLDWMKNLHPRNLKCASLDLLFVMKLLIVDQVRTY